MIPVILWPILTLVLAGCRAGDVLSQFGETFIRERRDNAGGGLGVNAKLNVSLSSCADSHPQCTQKKCDENPAVFLNKCRKTCDNCDGCKCFDAKGGVCKDVVKTKKCTNQGNKDKCPVSCGTCDKVVDANCNSGQGGSSSITPSESTSSATATTTSPSQNVSSPPTTNCICMDDPKVCHDVASSSDASCKLGNTSQQCPVTCNQCSKVLSPTCLAGNKNCSCRDDPGRDCQRLLRADPKHCSLESSSTYCPATCNACSKVCNLSFTTTTTNTTSSDSCICMDDPKVCHDAASSPDASCKLGDTAHQCPVTCNQCAKVLNPSCLSNNKNCTCRDDPGRDCQRLLRADANFCNTGTSSKTCPATCDACPEVCNSKPPPPPPDNCVCKDDPTKLNYCKTYITQKSLCTLSSVYKQCPLSCNQCAKVLSPSCNTTATNTTPSAGSTTTAPTTTNCICMDDPKNCHDAASNPDASCKLGNTSQQCPVTCNQCSKVLNPSCLSNNNNCTCRDDPGRDCQRLLRVDANFCTTGTSSKTCPATCNACAEACLKQPVIPTTNQTTHNISSTCTNKNQSFCTIQNFQLNPYDSYIQCRAFTNNCDGCKCEDSRYPLGSGGYCKAIPQSFCDIKSGATWHKCPLKCNKCAEILAPGCPACVDAAWDCSMHNCDLNSGTYYPKCKKTCNNCDGCLCVDSVFVDCGTYPGSGKCAEPEGLKCPVRCNLCAKVRAAANATNCPPWKVCTDENYSTDTKIGCTQKNCDNEPGNFLPKCRSTCNNCDGCKCYDSLTPTVPCKEFQTAGSCTNKDQLTNALNYCPATCGLCQNITTVGCASAKGRKRRSVCEKADDADCPESATLCNTKPGLYLNKCPNLCNNCDGLKCFDAKEYNCSHYKYNNLCHHPDYNSITSTYCPKTCGFCRDGTNIEKTETGLFNKMKKSWAPIFSPNKHDGNCQDESDCDGITTDDCDNRPGWFLQRCKKTCGNCKSSKCYNSKFFNCDIYTPASCSQNIKLFQYCPKLCGLCV